MKKYLKIFAVAFLTATVLLSCKNDSSSEIDDVLFKIQGQQKIDDKTFATLDSISNLELDEEQMAHYSLVRIIANNKAKIFDYPETDSLLKIATDFYIKGDDNYMKAMTYFQSYYVNYIEKSGNNATNTDLLLSALKAINKTKKVDKQVVKYSEITDANDEIIIEHLRQCILMGLGFSYQELGHYNDELNVFTEAAQFFERHDSVMLVSCYRQIGLCYFYQNNADSSTFYCKKALDICMQTNDYQMICGTLYLYGICYRNIDKRKTLDIFENANRIAYQHSTLSNFDAEIGQLFYELKDYDSAFYYTNRALSSKTNKSSTGYYHKNLYRTLFRTCKANGDFEEAAEYANTCISLFYSDKENDNIGSAFENYRKEIEAENQLYARKTKLITYILFALSIVAIFLIFTILYQKMMRKKESERLSAMQLAMQQKQSVQDNWLTNNKVFKKAVSLEKGVIEKSLVLSADDWKEFVNITNIVHNGFVLKLKELCPSLTENDIEVCCCSRYGFSEKTIAALHGIELRSFKRHRQRIMEKLGGEKGFYETLKQI